MRLENELLLLRDLVLIHHLAGLKRCQNWLERLREDRLRHLRQLRDDVVVVVHLRFKDLTNKDAFNTN